MSYRIRFKDANSATVYWSMAEGMEENARDDKESNRAGQLEALLKVLDTAALTVRIGDELKDIATDVLDNCLDNYGGEDEDTLEVGDVVIIEDKEAR